MAVFQQTVERETPLEVPESVAQHMASAAAAFPVVQEDDDWVAEHMATASADARNTTIDLTHTDVESVAEPEDERAAAANASQSMDVDVDQQTVGEPEPDEEMMASDEDDAPGEVEERRPLLLPTRVQSVNPEHEIALAAMRPHLYAGMGQGTCIDCQPRFFRLHGLSHLLHHVQELEHNGFMDDHALRRNAKEVRSRTEV